MGFNLGAGLAAADGFFQEQDHGQDRAYLQKQRDYQSQIMQAGLDTLGDQTAADRARLRLAAGTSNAGLDNLPAQTAADQARLSLSTATSNAGLDTLLGATKNTIARQDLERGDLTFAATQQPKTQQVAAAATDRAVADIPEQKAQQEATNAGKMTERHLTALRELGQYLEANDKAGALEVVNRYSDIQGLRSGTKGKRFVNIEMKGDGANGSYHLTAEDGSGVELPAAAVKQALKTAKTGKYSMHQGRAGDVYTLNQNTGDLQQKVAPSETYARTTSTARKPAQLQMAEAIMGAPEHKGMTLTQALEYVKTGLEKPRHQFILEQIAKTALPGSDPASEYQKWAKLYDDARASKPGPAPSNSVPNPTIDPKYQSLFTP